MSADRAPPPEHRPELGFRYRAAFIGEAGGDTELKEAALATAEEALRIACRDLRAGYRPIGVWAPDRSLLFSAAEIRDHCKRASPS